jgi:spore germination cell wall hydrolase CwlJ-like protein
MSGDEPVHPRPWHSNKQERKARRGPLRLLGVVLATGSCTTMQVAADESAQLAAGQVTLPLPEGAAPDLMDPAAAPALTGESALQANAALPLVGPGSAAPASPLLASANPLAQLRAHDCLAQAIYYEARSESEDGQRAVAQVVLNRVRHPAWPNSVCGVVYQGPMRAGGGCQFTFTCDGSLRFAPRGEGWMRARRLAAEALAGNVFEPVGLSTFYHANYVMPRWAPRLLKTAVIGTHLFYRLPGAGGQPGAFSSPYAGAEPVARPNPILVRYARGEAAAPVIPDWLAPTPRPGGGAVEVAEAPRGATPSTLAVQENVADLQIRPEYRQSGQWRKDAPAALTGR